MLNKENITLVTGETGTQGGNVTKRDEAEIKNSPLDPAMAVIRRNTDEVQGKGNWEVFDELFSEDFTDHTPQPGGFKADKGSVKDLYTMLRTAFPDFHAEIHWQTIDGDMVTSYKTYYGTHEGPIFGLEPTGRKMHFESVDVMRVRNGQITDHWGAGNLLSVVQQLGGKVISDDNK